MSTEVSISTRLLLLSVIISAWSGLTLSSVGTDNQAFAASQSDPASVSQLDEIKKSDEKKKKGKIFSLTDLNLFSCYALDGSEE